MKFDLKTPCKDCPFRITDRTKLADVVATLDDINDGIFNYENSSSCHKTNRNLDTEQYCAGSILSKIERGLSSSTLDMAIEDGKFSFSNMNTFIKTV